MTNFETYQRKFLKLELARIDKEATTPHPQAEFFSFRADSLPAEEIARRFVEILRLIDTHIELVPPSGRLLRGEHSIREADDFWRPLLPEWFTSQFSIDSDGAGLGFDLAGLSGKEIERRLQASEKAATASPGSLAIFLSDFALAERCWFYAGHRISGKHLDIAIERSEEPSSTFSLIMLVKHCGGTEAGDRENSSSRSWLGRLLGK